MTYDILVPSALVDIIMVEHGVYYGQTVTSTGVQQLNTIQVQIGQDVPLDRTPLGYAVIVPT